MKKQQDRADKAPRRRHAAADRERCRVLSRHAERVAGRLPWVRLLRERLLGDPAVTVTPEVAYRLLASPASAYVPLRQFEDLGIAWRDHRCEDLKVTPGLEPEVGAYRDVSLVLRGRGATERWAGRVTVADSEGLHAPRPVRYPTADGALSSTLAWPITPLGWLAAAAEHNAPDLLWSEPQAMWFVLTGQAPEVVPVTAAVEFAHAEDGEPVRGELVLRLQLFLGHRSAAKALATARREALRYWGLRSAYPMDVKTLALFQFVEEEADRNAGVRPDWGGLLERWNAGQRYDWRYRDQAHFRRDYHRARECLTQAPKPRKPARWVPSTAEVGR